MGALEVRLVDGSVDTFSNEYYEGPNYWNVWHFGDVDGDERLTITEVRENHVSYQLEETHKRVVGVYRSGEWTSYRKT